MKGIFVVGAGPAGLFAARQIALAGFDVFLFNRDVKPGGLAEYGIYPLKEKMKTGLRKQFAKVLDLPNVHYFGNVKIGQGYDLTLKDLEAFHPAAILFACGAQGTKKLGLPGEDLAGVYAAKDFVYHYNQLPPFASMDFSSGRRIAVVGMGNVAIDIARWLLLDDPHRRTEEVIIVARRGPLEIKFDKKEVDYISRHLSREQLVAELDRVKERCARVNQDVSPQAVFAQHFRSLEEVHETAIQPRLSFRFLSSPTAILPDAHGRIGGVEVAENELVLKPDGSTAAKDTGERTTIPVDTLIFAIGDQHDARIGLPMGREGYATKPNPDRPNHPSYEVWDPGKQSVLSGRFVAGWARQASTGLVGIARHDGEVGANKAIEYVKHAPDPGTLSPQEILADIATRGIHAVTKLDLALLAKAEQRFAQAGQPSLRAFVENEAMFNAVESERESMQAEAAARNAEHPSEVPATMRA